MKHFAVFLRQRPVAVNTRSFRGRSSK